MIDIVDIAIRSALWWLLLPGIGIPVSLIMYRKGQTGFLARLWVWFMVVPVFLGAAWLGRWVFAGLLSTCGMLALMEAERLQDGRSRRAWVLILGMAVTGSLPLLAEIVSQIPWDWGWVIWLLAPVGYFLVPRHRGTLIPVVLVALFVGVGLVGWQRLLAMPDGYRFVMIAFSSVTVADIISFVSGRLLPRVYVLKKLSPGKTLGGYAGGGLAAVAVGFIAWFAQPEMSAWQILVGAWVLSGSGAVGDLVASGIKRRHGVKDFSHLLGRMGGMFDRIDSLLGAGWAYWLYLYLIR